MELKTIYHKYKASWFWKSSGKAGDVPTVSLQSRVAQSHQECAVSITRYHKLCSTDDHSSIMNVVRSVTLVGPLYRGAVRITMITYLERQRSIQVCSESSIWVPIQVLLQVPVL